MFSLALHNISLGTSSPPKDVGNHALSVQRIELDRDALALFGIDVIGEELRHFDLVDSETHMRHYNCMFASWKRAQLEGQAVVLEGATIMYERWAEPEPPPSVKAELEPA